MKSRREKAGESGMYVDIPRDVKELIDAVTTLSITADGTLKAFATSAIEKRLYDLFSAAPQAIDALATVNPAFKETWDRLAERVMKDEIPKDMPI